MVERDAGKVNCLGREHFTVNQVRNATQSLSLSGWRSSVLTTRPPRLPYLTCVSNFFAVTLAFYRQISYTFKNPQRQKHILYAIYIFLQWIGIILNLSEITFVCCFRFSTRCFRPQKLAQLFQEITCKTETNRFYIIHLYRAFKSWKIFDCCTPRSHCLV